MDRYEYASSHICKNTTRHYHTAAESAVHPGDREALRAAAADATFRRPMLDDPPLFSLEGAALVLSPAGAYAAAAAAVELEGELVGAALAHQRKAESASRALCERGAETAAAALSRTLAAGFPPPGGAIRGAGNGHITTAGALTLMLATVGWIAEIPGHLAAAEEEARLRYRVRGAAAGAPLRQAVAAAALTEWRVLAAEEELRHLLAPAPEDTASPDWLAGAPPLESPPVLDSLLGQLCDEAETEERVVGEDPEKGPRRARLVAAAAGLAGVRAHAAALCALAETGVLEHVYVAQGAAVGCQLRPVRFQPLAFSNSVDLKSARGSNKTIVEPIASPSDEPKPPQSTRALSAARCFSREFGGVVGGAASAVGAMQLMRPAGARTAAAAAAMQQALVGALTVAVTHNADVISLCDDALFRRAVVLTARAAGTALAPAGPANTEDVPGTALALVWAPPSTKNARIYRAKQQVSTLADAVADLRDDLAPEAGAMLVSVAKAFERQRDITLHAYAVRSELARKSAVSKHVGRGITYPTGAALVFELSGDFTIVLTEWFRDAAARCDLARWSRLLRAAALGAIDVAGAGGDGKGGISLEPARLGPFTPGAVAAAAREVGMLPADVMELEFTPATMLRLGSSGELAPWMGGHAPSPDPPDKSTAAAAAAAVAAATAAAAAAATLNMDWSAASIWCLPSVADVLLTKAPYLALEEAHRLAAGVVSLVELRGAALNLLPGSGSGSSLLRDLERVAADVGAEGAATLSCEIDALESDVGGTGGATDDKRIKALRVWEAASIIERRASYERLRLATAVRRARRGFESAGDAAAFAAATAALAALESPAADLPSRAALRVSGLRPSRRAAVAAAAAAFDATAASRLTAEGTYDVIDPKLARRHCAYALGVAFVAEATEDALVGHTAAALRAASRQAAAAGAAATIAAPPPTHSHPHVSVRRRFMPPRLLARVIAAVELAAAAAAPPHATFAIPEGKSAEDVNILMSCAGNAGSAAVAQRRVEARVVGLKRALDEHLLCAAVERERATLRVRTEAAEGAALADLRRENSSIRHHNTGFT